MTHPSRFVNAVRSYVSAHRIASSTSRSEQRPSLEQQEQPGSCQIDLSLTDEIVKFVCDELVDLEVLRQAIGWQVGYFTSSYLKILSFCLPLYCRSSAPVCV